MAQQTLDNNEALSVQRGKINNNALDAVSQSDTADQALASNVDFAAGKGPSFDGVDYTPILGGYDVVLSPQTSGTITVNASFNRLAYHKNGPQVLIVGEIIISSVSAPVGDYVAASLPFPIYDLLERSGRIGGSLYSSISSLEAPVSYSSVEDASEIRINIDASTLSANDKFSFSINYLTGA